MNSFQRITSIDTPTLSIVVPCFNEEAVLEEFHERTMRALNALNISWELIYVDDGSSDNTPDKLREFTANPFVRRLHLSRNFGKEAALCAGLDHAQGHAIVFIDADLQDPPELLPTMIDYWQEGYDVVNMQRSSRRCDSAFKRFTAASYYALMHRMNPRLSLPSEVSDFRLLGPRALRALRDLPERSRMTKGLIGWLGFETIELPYERAPRSAGNTKWNYPALADLAIEGIVSFSRKPLRWFTYSAAFLFIASLAASTYAIAMGEFSLNWLLLNGIAFVAAGIGMAGEYIGAILEETKQRPHYLIADRDLFSEDAFKSEVPSQRVKQVAL